MYYSGERLSEKIWHYGNLEWEVQKKIRNQRAGSMWHTCNLTSRWLWPFEIRCRIGYTEGDCKYFYVCVIKKYMKVEYNMWHFLPKEIVYLGRHLLVWLIPQMKNVWNQEKLIQQTFIAIIFQ